MSSKDDMRARAKRCFEEADADGTGCLSKMELYKIVEQCGYNQSPDEIVGWFDDIDTNDDDKITCQEFIKEIVDKRPASEVTDADLRAEFKTFDTDGSGQVNKSELVDYFNAHPSKKEGCSDEQIDGMINASDTSGDGRISVDEFLSAFRNAHP